jgi:hypothetical protein
MANFLVVCGGTGRGILSSLSDIGFDAALQIDVENQAVSAADGNVLHVKLPVSEDIGMTSLTAISWLERILETQIEDSAGKVSDLAKKINELKKQLDELLTQDQDVVGGDVVKLKRKLTELETLLSDEKQNRDVLNKRLLHAQKGKSIAAPANIVDGMSQAPLIGRAYVEMEAPTTEIKQAIAALKRYKQPHDNEITFWIIASMCGGTGQGIYLHVIDQIRNLKGTFGNVVLKIRVVRIGSLTYKSINPQIQLNAFWSLASDYGFIYKQTKEAGRINADYEVSYYYLDLQDVGAGNQAIPIREDIVKTAFKAITQRELDQEFKKVFNNLVEAPKVVIARLGEWGAEFKPSDLYAETISEISSQLDALIKSENKSLLNETKFINPSPTIVNNKSNISSYPSSDDDFRRVITEDVLSILKRDMPNSPIAKETMVTYFQRTDWKNCTDLIRAMFGGTDTCFNQIAREVSLRIGWNNSQDSITNLSGSLEESKFSPEYLLKLRHAKQIILRTEELMFKSEPQNSLHQALLNNWASMRNKGSWLEEISRDDNARRRDVISHFDMFIESYAKILRLANEYASATKIVDQASKHMATLLTVVSEQLAKVRPSQQAVPVTQSSPLHTMIGAKTWLQIIDESLSGNVQTAVDSGKFMEAALLGAQGLTEEGFKRVIGVPNDYNLDQVVEKLNSSVGNNPSTWFQDIEPDFTAIPPTFQFKFRVFPQMPDRLFNELIDASIAWGRRTQRPVPTYVKSSDPRSGLRVYGVESIAAHDKEINQQYSMLISPLTASFDRNNPYFVEGRYESKNCLLHTGTPVYLPAVIGAQNTSLHTLRNFILDEMQEFISVYSASKAE